jgi:hypothetical protein
MSDKKDTKKQEEEKENIKRKNDRILELSGINDEAPERQKASPFVKKMPARKPVRPNLEDQ